MAFNWKNSWQYLVPGYGGAKLAYDVGSKVYDRYKNYTSPTSNSGTSSGANQNPSFNGAANVAKLRANWIKSMEDFNSSLNYSSPAPTMPEYKPMNYNWEQAMSEAAPSVNTYYDKTLQDYLKTVETRKTRTTEDLATQMANYDTQGRYLGEDYSTNMANLATNANLAGKAEAQTNTANRGALQGGLAGSGMTFSGLGQEKLNQQDVARRLSLAAATAQLNQSKGAIETSKVRGMEAIGTGKKSATTASTRQLEDIETERAQKQQDIEYQRSADIAERASQLYAQQQAAWKAANPYWA